jgi:ubiquitin carboxyl-terminal hydrolase 9/24
MMNIDCQIRNKTSIHEALSDMCEDEIMEGDNKVLCDSCKVKTNTVLRTAISALPDVLVLSLKRFDLDYTTFETVKLNSRCEFGEALNMKKYTLQAKEVLEAADRSPENDNRSEFGSTMDIEESETKDGNDEEDPLSVLPDEDYEYRLAGVLVHAGVAQGGHYYSFIKDRTSAKWYRFDDEDVTPFDPSSIEHECFGGKVKKETKFPNGNTHTVESEQFANALMLFYEKVKPVQFATAAPMEEESNAAQSNLEYSNGYDMFLPEVRKSNSIHSWQSFLLTDEFQKFVKEILDVCAGGKKLNGEEDSMDITPASSPSPVILGTGMESWRLDGIRMSLSFVFDVLFHLSLKKDALDDWSKILQQVFSSSYDISAMFVSDLAKRTHQVYENWVRAFTMECPEEGSRRTALQIFSCAISSLLNNPTEQSLLQHWTQSWESQISAMDKIFANNRQGCVMPTRLEAVGLRPREDLTQIGVTATSIGIILSFLTQLIEVSPRYTQANIELCFFIRELASCQAPTARILRDAMVEAHFIARLSCLAIREKTHEVLRTAFPGSSLPLDVVEAISREETLSSNIMHVGMNNSGIHGGGRGSQLLLEAIGCLLGTTWIKQEAISFEKEDVNRGRNVRALTPRATEALTAVFEESKPRSSSGMILRDINLYLQKCGQHVPPQRIDQIFSRHAVDEPDGSKLLTLEGFLAYYRDAVHSNEYQVRESYSVLFFLSSMQHISCHFIVLSSVLRFRKNSMPLVSDQILPADMTIADGILMKLVKNILAL